MKLWSRVPDLNRPTSFFPVIENMEAEPKPREFWFRTWRFGYFRLIGFPINAKGLFAGALNLILLWGALTRASEYGFHDYHWLLFFVPAGVVACINLWHTDFVDLNDKRS
jgi:hypothetical protein